MRKGSTLQFRIEACVVKRLKDVAAKKGTSISEILLSAVWQFLNRHDSKNLKALKKQAAAAEKLNKPRGRPPLKKWKKGKKKAKKALKTAPSKIR